MLSMEEYYNNSLFKGKFGSYQDYISYYTRWNNICKLLKASKANLNSITIICKGR